MVKGKNTLVKLFIFSFFIISFTHFFSFDTQAKDSLQKLSKEEFLTAYEETMEESWPTLALLYSRINPDLKNLVPGKEWTDEDRTVSECIYDKMQSKGKLKEYISFVERLDTMEKAILANEDINVFNVSQYPEIEQMPSIDGYMEAISSCGLISLMQKRMTESGLWLKLTQSVGEGS